MSGADGESRVSRRAWYFLDFLSLLGSLVERYAAMAVLVSVPVVVAVPAEAAGWKTVVKLPKYVDSVAVAGPRDVWAATTDDLRHWNGRRWKSFKVAGVSGYTNLAAAGPDDVWAVSQVPGDGNRSQVVRWDGRRWKRLPQTVFGGFLEAVAAWPGGVFWRTDHQTDWRRPAISRWRSGRWVRTPAPARETNAFGGKPTSFWAVGDGAGGLSALRYGEGKWRRTKTPALSRGRYGSLYTVASTSARTAWAGGATWNEDAVDHRPVLLRWNGRTWKKIDTRRFGEGGVGALVPDPRGGVWMLLGDDGPVHYASGRWRTLRTPEGGAARELFAVPGTRQIWSRVETSTEMGVSTGNVLLRLPGT